MSEAVLVLTGKNDTEVRLDKALSLVYEKERYTPYSSLKGMFRYESDYSGEFTDVSLVVNGTEIHKGAVDYCAIRIYKGERVIELASRGYTSMMGQTEMVPGISSGPSLNSFMSGWKMPFVTHEDLSHTVNYLYIKEHASLWEALVNLCLKQNQNYPYIAFTNEVRFSPKESPKTIELNESDPIVTGFGSSLDYSHMISDLHMRDTEGTYNTFNLVDEEIRGLNIVRHKHFPLDRQWLDNPERGLGYKINFAMRGWRSMFVSYQGYQGEDLLDKLSWNGESPLNISRIKITGNANGIFTKLWCYKDRYCNTEE